MQYVGYSYIENYLKESGIKFFQHPWEMVYFDNAQEYHEFSKSCSGNPPSYLAPCFAERSKKGFEFEDKLFTVGTSKIVPQSLMDNIVFSVESQGINLHLLKKIFCNMDKKEVQDFVEIKPTGKYHRKVWFLYEFLTGRTLEIDDLPKKNYIDLLEENKYFTAPAIKSKRHAINNNLLGDKYFCPMVRKTYPTWVVPADEGDEPVFRKAITKTTYLKNQAHKSVNDIDPQIVYRAIRYMYTKETKDSFEIERAKPSQMRLAKFASVLEKQSIDPMDATQASLVKLQHSFVDERYQDDPFREKQIYVGETMGLGQEDFVHFIGAKYQDLQPLMDGLLACYNRVLSPEVDEIVAAAVVAFGFVYLHPFQDGNGRIHRYLIHNVLAKKEFTPKEVVFPISAYMLKNPVRYDKALEAFSKHLMANISYYFDDKGSIQVDDDTADFYRYMDLTAQAEYLFECVEHTIDKEFKQEIEYLIKSDKARSEMQEVVDMPNDRLNFFIALVTQNRGKLSKAKRELFNELTDDEVAQLEAIIKENLI